MTLYMFGVTAKDILLLFIGIFIKTLEFFYMLKIVKSLRNLEYFLWRWVLYL